MNIGMVLSGGGIRGVAHIGAIKALEEHNIAITHIAGTSIGAIIGALYAYGYNCEKILAFFKKVQLFNVKKYALNKPGFIDAEKYYNFFRSYFPEDNFNALKIGLSITATNILEGKLEVFEHGELIKPVLASAAFPGVFSPVKMKNTLYIDGGVLNNFPVELLQNDCEIIFGVYVNQFEPTEINNFKHFHNIIERAITIRVVKDDAEKFSDCDLVVVPKKLSHYGFLDKKNIDAIYKIGYNSMTNALDEMDIKTKQKLLACNI